MTDFLEKCSTQSHIYSAQDRMNAMYYEAKYFGNSSLADIRAGNFKVAPAKDIFHAVQNVAEHENVKTKSKFKKFLSRVGNSFKNFFSIREKH